MAYQGTAPWLQISCRFATYRWVKSFREDTAVHAIIDGSILVKDDIVQFDMEESKVKPGQMQAINVSGGTGQPGGGKGSGKPGSSQGTVKNFREDKGFGFITLSDGSDLFMHIKDVALTVSCACCLGRAGDGHRQWAWPNSTNGLEVLELVWEQHESDIPASNHGRDGLKKRSVDGIPTSLCDLGYCNVGLDEGWEDCMGGHQFHYHDDSGKPLVWLARFPNITSMTEHAHRLGLTAGWYLNGCTCPEKEVIDSMYDKDVAALVAFGFDAVKLDNCGAQHDLDKWAGLINKTGRKVMIENCHWGKTVPTETWCPWNFFRTSGDVRASYGSVVANLQTTVQWAQRNLSKPGCWAYPDMLEVGCNHGPGGDRDPGLSYPEARSHFSAWSIVSSPLTLSMDINDDDVMNAVWGIVSNKEVIAVNQAYAGHSGSPFKQSASQVTLKDDGHYVTVPTWQFFYKPLGGSRTAVLLMNHDRTSHDLVLNFKDVPGLACQKCTVRCLYGHRDLGEHEHSFTAQAVQSHDSRMFILMPAQAQAVVV
ncbi:unnamed protein product [Symbiodinium sp. KB8]|nr:unnamed protein product [Symbiodinium sp. KB8]